MWGAGRTKVTHDLKAVQGDPSLAIGLPYEFLNMTLTFHKQNDNGPLPSLASKVL